ncbi:MULTISPECIES: 1-deoxy-D-xylulose-5-phosphate synthase [Dietzia]|uniref:1-deoxy-D-xylulose-5-phosphate synthase n=1 Tax=Dietzia cinnamea TaxID=321318 RepID=A0A4V2W8G2_9ACTN|nr:MULTISPECIES: 1-deoxy-D-xylulose-5-phosphate synthase [Dietzia]KZO60388.1 1-deoxy-D-xylulose-5-phosphate synthase [Dietzia maris]MCT1864766.1 1-deoxy-D-xylulose-5-phosphate synthase [Dietzia cinnamea]MCT1885715.1 1-deoxy-D-xylulose-5-phosphate synthase [Dietzia cinnamea]MCT2030732.1 1-deoxy-D-xylulose-5-phosphate synthase [Dietzia cinnamea]MCT2034213.1 1-deoxy-D-xylulose-5-phosphate synthase [Dietzia cinnamea]
MSVLDQVNGPSDLRGLGPDELGRLCGEIREFLIRKVAATGGHLGPNLGVVELTVALHRVFDSPRDPIVFDTGHQSYVHKMLTGRRDCFDGLRTRGGLSGYPCRAESEHDIVESSHATASLSYADGLAKAFALRGERDRTVVTVIGDGAMTGGMAWEALNNIAAAKDRPMVIVVNDNGRSYSPTIGGLAERLGALRLQPAYEKAMDRTKSALTARKDVVGKAVYSVLHGIKAGVKDVVSPQELFADLGLKYMGPVDGHNLAATEAALRLAKDFGGPVVVHVVTRKGMGYVHAENNEADQMHATGVIDPETGKPLSTSSSVDWTSVFSEELCAIGTERDDVVAITAAMAGPTGLAAFGERFPDRMFDVGIAEQHAVASASGLALGGMHPVVAVYSTFLNRAFDQLLMDVALLRQPVTLVLDRSGVTGPDGASHNGMWDLSLTGIVPGVRVAAPRDALTLRQELREAVAVDDGPTVVRFPKGSVGEPVPALATSEDGVDRVHGPGDAEVLVVAVGPMVAPAVAAARALEAEGISVDVVDPRWVYPVPASIVESARGRRLVVTVEDNGLHGGVGSAVSARLDGAAVQCDRIALGIPQEFLDHGSRAEILSEAGLTAEGIAESIRARLAL